MQKCKLRFKLVCITKKKSIQNSFRNVTKGNLNQDLLFDSSFGAGNFGSYESALLPPPYRSRIIKFIHEEI